MLALKEFVSDYNMADIPHSDQLNLEELLKRMNLVRKAWKKPMTVTSGYRSMQDHLRIYSKINADRRAKGLPELAPPKGSKHLIGAAADISDPDGSLHKWCIENEALLTKIGLWMEVKDEQKRVHFQIFPPKSGNRFFKP